jgi:hypothetical protein
MEIEGIAKDPYSGTIRSIIAAALSSANVPKEGEHGGYFLELSHRNIELKVNIPGLSEIGWTSLMFEAAGALEEFLGGPCKLNILSTSTDTAWFWDEVNGLKIGTIANVKPLGVPGLRTKALVKGAFALKKTEVELFEYFVEIGNHNFQANITQEEGFMKIEIGAEASSEIKLSVNLGEIGLSLEDAAKLKTGAKLKFSRPETHSVLLSVNNSPYAIGEATWGEGGVEIKVINIC